MKKIIKNFVIATISYVFLSGGLVAAEEVILNEEIEIGKKIYDRSFGRGCGACHDIASNPQLFDLVADGSLSRDEFSDVIIFGKNGMPKAIAAIMAVGPVKTAGYTEDQAIEALYDYLEFQGDGQGTIDGRTDNVVDVEINNDETLPEGSDNANEIILNSDFSFNIPRIKFIDPEGVEHYFNVDFVYAPVGNKVLFEPVRVVEIQ